MQNVQLFNEFALRIFDHLGDAFPLPCKIDPVVFIERVELSPYPPSPALPYCGPDLTWSFSPEESRQLWKAHPWDEAVAQAELLLKRKLSDDEERELRSHGQRPLTAEEQHKITEWEAEKQRIDEQRTHQWRQNRELTRKREIFIATLQFLTNEQLIRFTDLPPARAGTALNPPDILIQKTAKELQFVLTNKGVTHLNRTFNHGKLSRELPLYSAIKQALRNQLADGISAATIQTLAGWLLK